MLLSRIDDFLERGRPCVTDFLDRFARTEVSDYVKRRGFVYECGGLENAERARLVVSATALDEPEKYSLISAIHVKSTFAPLTHRDVLGAVLALGIKRELVGDIYISENDAHIISDKKIAGFIAENLVSVGKSGVSCSICELCEIPPPVIQTKSVRLTVASLRTDVVACAAFSLSRTRISELISARLLFVNHREVKSASKPLNCGDTITLRGTGRATVDEILGESRKGRIILLLSLTPR